MTTEPTPSAAGGSAGATRGRPQAWRRLALAHGLQVPAVVAVVLTPAAWLPAALWSSVVCCLLTDSGWRWRNRLLVAEAAGWLTLALSTFP